MFAKHKFSSKYIENEMVTLTSETLSYEYCFETKIPAKYDKYDQSFEQQEEELIGLKVKQQMEPNKFSS